MHTVIAFNTQLVSNSI